MADEGMSFKGLLKVLVCLSGGYGQGRCEMMRRRYHMIDIKINI